MLTVVPATFSRPVDRLEAAITIAPCRYRSPARLRWRPAGTPGRSIARSPTCRRERGSRRRRGRARAAWLPVRGQSAASQRSRRLQAGRSVATCLEEQHPGDPAALLLRGHALHQLHRFHEAEAIARTLVTKREFVLDYALLGDALMEQGRLAEAAAAYQKMIDLKPFYQSYTRAAHLRWLTGDLDGAIELTHKAIATASPAQSRIDRVGLYAPRRLRASARTARPGVAGDRCGAVLSA